MKKPTPTQTAPETADIFPTTGGSYAYDPATGKLERLVEAPRAAPQDGDGLAVDPAPSPQTQAPEEQPQ